MIGIEMTESLSQRGLARFFDGSPMMRLFETRNQNLPNATPRSRWRSTRRTAPILLIDLLDKAVAMTELNFGRKGSAFGPPQICELPHDWFQADREETTGRWLADQAKMRGFRAQRVLVLIPRSMASVKMLETPAIPNDELIRLMELQAETESLTPFADLVWTFVRGAQSPVS